MPRDIRELDLNLLRTLDALLDERNVTYAAQRLGFTQPAVSGMLTRLRESFNDPLFVRTQRGMVPTSRASELSGPVKRILSEIDALLQPTDFDPLTASFTLSVAATDYALQVVLVPFLASLRTRAPGIRVAIRPIASGNVLTQFERGDLDLALMTPETAHQDLHARKLFDETYICAMRDGHPEAVGDVLSLDSFCSLDHALISFSGERFRGVTDDALAGVGRERRVALTITSFLALLELLRLTDLVAVVPHRLVDGVDGLTTMKPPVNIPGFTKLAVWHERTHRDPGHRWVRNLLIESFCHRTGDSFSSIE